MENSINKVQKCIFLRWGYINKREGRNERKKKKKKRKRKKKERKRKRKEKERREPLVVCFVGVVGGRSCCLRFGPSQHSCLL